MIYEVKEKKFHEIIGIKKILDYEALLKHLETTFELEKYLLEVKLSYVDIDNKEELNTLNLPIDFDTSMTEQVSANLNSVEFTVDENKGVNIIFNINVIVEEIENNNIDIIEEKKEIKETYQQELEEIINIREDTMDNKVNVIVENSAEDNYNFLNLSTTYIKYKVINLDENSLDKISIKYNISMEKLYNIKNSNNKLIVYDKE